VPDVLAGLQDPAEVQHVDLYEHVAHRWHEGRVVLLGDAAHTFIPGFGAAMALEDA